MYFCTLWVNLRISTIIACYKIAGNLIVIVTHYFEPIILTITNSL